MNTAEYLIKKLEELGVNDFFGLPGDYNFNILYAIENNPNTNWIGCTNELNAGYAADGYARERGYGALVTTYGVGELSAMNAIAGSFAENVPVIHIVGAPLTKHLDNKTLIHHNFREVKPFAYADAFKNVVEATAFLNRDNAKFEIDRILKIFVKERRPVYIAIPIDIATMDISDRPTDFNWYSDEQTLNTVIKLAAEKINQAQHPIILGDTLIKRFDARIEYKEFVAQSGIPTTNFLMGTNIINNDCKNYLGSYYAGYKNPKVQKAIEETDCLIAVGTIYSDLNSYGFNLPFKINSHIAIYGTYTYIDGIKYENVKMSDILNGLSETIQPKNCNIEPEYEGYEQTSSPSGKITSEYIYPRLQEFLKENDIFIAETGIIPQGAVQMKFPPNTECVTQTLWGSIGWATPATLGSCIASPQKRVILFTGEGSHQLTAMEIGNMLRCGIKPVILVLNNNGYTIERLLSENPDDNFNNIVQMNYAKFARVFEGDIWSTKVETQEDFDRALKVTQIMNKLCYIEICTDSNDIPELTRNLINNLKTTTPKNIVKTTEYKNKLDTVNLQIPNPDCNNYTTKVHESLRDE